MSVSIPKRNDAQEVVNANRDKFNSHEHVG
jgi:hypothetical protein